MSEIKKWVGDKIKSLGRQLEDGRPDRLFGSIDYSGPVPRVTILNRKTDNTPVPKLKRGFWAAPPADKNGVLFENAETVIKADFKHAAGTYVVASFAASYGGSGLSAEKYHDVWYMDKAGGLYINGYPFVSPEDQKGAAAGGLFFPGVSVDNAGNFTYEKKNWVTVYPHVAATQRMVGGANPTVGATSLALAENNVMFSASGGQALADIAPGWHWTFNRVDGKVWATFVTQGARAIYNAASVNNLAPISTGKIVYDFKLKTASYTHTGGAYSGDYATPGDAEATITVKPDDPSGIVMPVVGTSGGYTTGSRTNTFNEGSNCGLYGGVPDSITSNFTANIASPVTADLKLTPPENDFLLTTPLHTEPVVAPPNTGQTFFGVSVAPSLAETGDGKRGSYSGVATIVEWGLSDSAFPHFEYAYGAGAPQIAGTSSAEVPYPQDGHYMGAWSESLRVPANQIARIGARSTPPPSVAVNDPRYYHGTDLRRRLFNGTVSKTGYKSECGVSVSTAFGELSNVDVGTSFRYTSATGTKYDQPALEYANIPVTMNGGSGDAGTKLPTTTWFTMSVGLDLYGNTCQWSPFWGTVEHVSEVNNGFKTEVEEGLTLLEADVAARHYFWWHHTYASVPYTSSAYSDTKTKGGTRYVFTTKDYLFYNPDFEITIESSLVKDYGFGPSFDQEGDGSTAQSLTIIMNTKYRGALLDSRTIYSGWPSAYLNFNDKYYGMGQGWDSFYDPMNSFPKVTCREPLTGIFPTFCMQECCPFVAFTTSAEVTNGAEPQCYVDMPIVLCAPTSVGDSTTQVRFAPMQLLNNLIWMTAPLEGDSDASVSAYSFLDNLHLHFLDNAPIKLRLFTSSATGTVIGTLPTHLQTKYGTSQVHFGRV